ncbi:hypothetical protein NDU88_007587 [Pleurodeles waltl]|uniref:Uncharacterized protein n=1 Tax=Pleurodeles waltl TaxID=8319 RepID=A0AAV7PLR4_PLEWA|nr:hypothetical protein NDU88_007587 [Pleurodeles waltl]
MLLWSLLRAAARVRAPQRARPSSTPYRTLVRLSRSWAQTPGDSFMPQSISAVSGLGDPRIPGPHLRLSCCVFTKPSFCPAALLRRLGRPSARSRPVLSWLASNSAPGAPPHASDLSWRSPGPESHYVYAKIRGCRELRFTRAAPSASGHAPCAKSKMYIFYVL